MFARPPRPSRPGEQSNGGDKSYNSVSFPVFTLNAAPVSGGTIALVGNPGPATWYYWAVANYPVGSVISYLGSISNAPNVLSSGNLRFHHAMVLPCLRHFR